MFYERPPGNTPPSDKTAQYLLQYAFQINLFLAEEISGEGFISLEKRPTRRRLCWRKPRRLPRSHRAGQLQVSVFHYSPPSLPPLTLSHPSEEVDPGATQSAR
jgi:hypothetical protein